MDHQQQLARILLDELNLPDADFSEETIEKVNDLFNKMPDWQSFIENRLPHLIALTGEAIFHKWPGTWEQDPNDPYPHLLINGKKYDFNDFHKEPETFEPNLIGINIIYDLTYISVDMDMIFENLKGREQVYDYNLHLNWQRFSARDTDQISCIEQTIAYLSAFHPSLKVFAEAPYVIEQKRVGKTVRLYTHEQIELSNSLSILFDVENIKFAEYCSVTISPLNNDLNNLEKLKEMYAGLVKIWQPEFGDISYKGAAVFSQSFNIEE